MKQGHLNIKHLQEEFKQVFAIFLCFRVQTPHTRQLCYEILSQVHQKHLSQINMDQLKYHGPRGIRSLVTYALKEEVH